MSAKLFEFPDDAWVPNAKQLFERHLDPASELFEPAVEICIAITNMMKCTSDALQGRKCGNGVYMMVFDMFRKLQHNGFWKIFGAEITARFANGLSRTKEAADMMSSDYKPSSEVEVAEFMAHQFAWIDALVFIAETMGVADLSVFREDVRSAFYGS